MNVIEINENRCKGCGLCVGFCPKDVLEMRLPRAPQVIREDLCIGCKQCELKCPDFAITVEVKSHA
ncbi:MAG: 4Fe-4S binding protein [Clostridiales Family XIII bacterium]|jgi:2-oxoglutarate ferredoxin oxidoreductase subunit delta|nr:4Fe-4S binding protein [Clostridiales Family XIII bacterium]